MRLSRAESDNPAGSPYCRRRGVPSALLGLNYNRRGMVRKAFREISDAYIAAGGKLSWSAGKPRGTLRHSRGYARSMRSAVARCKKAAQFGFLQILQNR